VFSPYYARARRRAAGRALDHCALNVVLYAPGSGRKRWAMTERGEGCVARDAATLDIGPSSLHWDGAALELLVDEWTVPLPSRIRGRVRVLPEALAPRHHVLDAAGAHCWHPLAPAARIEVELARPALRWSGRAYLDTNWGDEPAEAAFRSWHWSRTPVDARRTAVLYDVRRRDGGEHGLALCFGGDGTAEPLAAPQRAPLPPAPVWRIARETRTDAGGAARVVRTLEDSPFYARSLVASRLLGAEAIGVHESLSLDRFRTRWVQTLLPFRMPRRP